MADFNPIWLYRRKGETNDYEGLIIRDKETYDNYLENGWYHHYDEALGKIKPKKEIKESLKEEIKETFSNNENEWLIEFKKSIEGRKLKPMEAKQKKDELEKLALENNKLDLNKKYSLPRMIKKLEHGDY